MSIRVYFTDSVGFLVDTPPLFAHPNPEEPDNPLIPDYAVPFAPPLLGANQCAKLNAAATAWVVLPDWRGTVYWLEDKEHLCTQRGVELPDGAVLEKPSSVVAKELVVAKAAALQRIENVADAYQQRFLGANSADRQARFAHNLAAAQRFLADAYGSDAASQQLKMADELAMQVQADAQNAKPDAPVQMTASGFAQWVIEWLPKSAVISAYIENILVTGRVGLNALTDIEQIEPFLANLAAQAEVKFAEMVG